MNDEEQDDELDAYFDHHRGLAELAVDAMEPGEYSDPLVVLREFVEMAGEPALLLALAIDIAKRRAADSPRTENTSDE